MTDSCSYPTIWIALGGYEYEYRFYPDGSSQETGLCRCVGGLMSDGTWPTFRVH